MQIVKSLFVFRCLFHQVFFRTTPIGIHFLQHGIHFVQPGFRRKSVELSVHGNTGAGSDQRIDGCGIKIFQKGRYKIIKAVSLQMVGFDQFLKIRQTADICADFDPLSSNAAVYHAIVLPIDMPSVPIRVLSTSFLPHK